MGEYFAWANIDKKERLDMAAFDWGFKMMEPCWVGNRDIDAFSLYVYSPPVAISQTISHSDLTMITARCT